MRRTIASLIQNQWFLKKKNARNLLLESLKSETIKLLSENCKPKIKDPLITIVLFGRLRRFNTMTRYPEHWRKRPDR